ncbi:MAG: hypothetical protein U0744_11855 [Gemmataceae bacterium]
MLDALVAAGNTVVVVEHHLDMLKAARVIELGPEAGAAGGQVVAMGTAEDLAKNPASPTGGFGREAINRHHRPNRQQSACASSYSRILVSQPDSRMKGVARIDDV